MTKNKNKKSLEAAKQEAFKLSDGICYCKTPAVDIIYKKNTQKDKSSKRHYIMRMEYEPELIIRNSTGKCRS